MFGFVVRRLRARLPLAMASLLAMLITTAALTTLAAFNGNVGDAGMRRALQGPDFARTSVLVTADGDAAGAAGNGTVISGLGRDLFDPLPSTARSVGRSHPYSLPGASANRTDPDLTLLASLDRDRSLLLSGSWPKAVPSPGAPVEVAVPQSAVARLGLTGASLPVSLDLADRTGGGSLSVRVTGVYRAADPADPYWRLDPLGGHGIKVLGFTTYGPFLVDDSAFTRGGLAMAGRTWLVTADYSRAHVADAQDERDRVGPLIDAFKRDHNVLVATDLPSLLDELNADLVVARSTLLIGALQLAVLATAALLLVVGLLTERQAAENELLLARGASRRRIGALTAGEALVLALPAAVLAPALTPLLLRLLTSYGPMAGMGIESGLPAIAWPVAALCGAGCVLVAALPALLRSAGAATLRRAGRRQALVAGAVRHGADLALIALAVVAYQQLSHYGGGPALDAAGQLGVDPVLVAAPTLALCAGTVLALRLLPLAAWLGERLAGRGRGLHAALTGWQFARRPRRGAGPVLLLVLAVSMGILALGQRAAWTQSQRDQADFTAVGGLRISSSSITPMGQGGFYSALPGGDRIIPVVRKDQPLPGGANARILAVDAAGVAERVNVRPDLLGGRSIRDLFAPIAEPAKAGIPLPGHPQRLDLTLTTKVLSRFPAPPAGGPQPALSADLSLRVLLRDRFGVIYQVLLSDIPEEGDRTYSVDLTPYLGVPLGSAAAPLSVVGVAVSVPQVPGGGATGELALDRIAVADTADGAAEVAQVPPDLGWSSGQAGGSDGVSATATADGARPLVVDYQAKESSGKFGEVSLMSHQGTQAPTAATELKGIATREYLSVLDASVGDLLTVQFGTVTVPVRIVAAVEALPSTDGPALAVDLAGLDRLVAEHQQAPFTPDEWWLPADGPTDHRPAEAAAQLRASGATQTLQLREELAAALRGDPLGAAPQAALAGLAVAAGVLAAIGFAAAATSAASERAGEFAVLVALGASGRRLARTVAVEQGILAGLGLAIGTALGALLADLVVPLVVLTPAARRPMPPVLVHLAAAQIALLLLAVAAGPVVSAVLGGRRHRDLTAQLRYSEEA